MTLAQEILSQPDVFLAIRQKRAAKKAELNLIQQNLAKVIEGAISPMPRATNRIEYAMQIARNVFNIWQGINMGLKIVRGFRSAFRK